MDRHELDAALEAAEDRAASRFRGRLFWGFVVVAVGAFAWWRYDTSQREAARERVAREEREAGQRRIDRWQSEIDAMKAGPEAGR